MTWKTSGSPTAVDDPRELTIREGREMFLDKHRSESSDETVKDYHYTLKQFTLWCEEAGIERVSDLSGFHFEQFERYRRGDVAPVTLHGQMKTVRGMMKYLARIDAVDSDLPEKVHIPKVSKDEASNDEKLAVEDAEALLNYYRNSTADYATVHHAILEVLWHTGCRMAGLQALDLEDFNREENYLYFRHRPDSGTRLKNGVDGERVVKISPKVTDVLKTYIVRERHNKRDDHGRQPLIACRQGRPAKSTIRAYTYQATQPCLHSECPHGKVRSTCEWTERNQSSRCPSSMSPHKIRTGSISWHLNRGLPLEVVSDRVNASEKIIRRHYDKESEIERMRTRRAQFTEDLDVDTDDTEGDA